MGIGTFSCQSSQCVTYTGRMPPSFFDNATSRPLKMMEHTSVSKAPASIKFTKSTRVSWRLSSVAPANSSLMCCAVMPSGPPDEPSGKVRRAFIMSSLDTCSGSKRGLPPGSHGLRRSIAGSGCFACRAFSVSWLTGASVSLEQTILTVIFVCTMHMMWPKTNASSIVVRSIHCCVLVENCFVPCQLQCWFPMFRMKLMKLMMTKTAESRCQAYLTYTIFKGSVAFYHSIAFGRLF